MPDSSPSPSSVIVLTLDGLRSSSLGAYGNTMGKTRTLDRLASESFLFDQYRLDGTSLEASFRSLISGQHHLASLSNNSLPEIVGASGGYSVFFTDDERLAEAETIAQFDRIVVHQSEMLKQPASSLVETHFAGFLSHLLEESLELPAGSLLWAHAKGLTGPWDVPMEDRAALNAPDDPDPIPFVDPPHSDNLPEFPEDDPNAEEDYRLMIQQAYSAQVSMVDQLLGAFLEHADPIVSDSYLYFMSTRGYPLGEHDTIGTGDSLFPENVHLPLLIRPPNGTDGTRSRTLLQPTDVYTLLRSHFENRFDSALAQRNSLLGNPASEVSVLRNDQETALVTHAWKAIISKGDVKLFVKPDDRWDVNDISDRCPEVVQEMVELWNTIRNELGNTTTLGPIELPQSLTTPIR